MIWGTAKSSPRSSPAASLFYDAKEKRKGEKQQIIVKSDIGSKR